MRIPQPNQTIPVRRTLAALVLLAVTGISLGYTLLSHLDRHFGDEDLSQQEMIAGSLFRTASAEQAR